MSSPPEATPPSRKYVGALSQEEMEFRNTKVIKFFNFIFYEWGDERKGN